MMQNLELIQSISSPRIYIEFLTFELPLDNSYYRFHFYEEVSGQFQLQIGNIQKYHHIRVIVSSIPSIFKLKCRGPHEFIQHFIYPRDIDLMQGIPCYAVFILRLSIPKNNTIFEKYSRKRICKSLIKSRQFKAIWIQ